MTKQTRVRSATQTNIMGLVISSVVGCLVAAVTTSVFLFLTGLSFENWWWLPCFIPGLVSAASFFTLGQRKKIEVGHVGVPMLLGTRLRGVLLSEGDHWLFPWLYDFEDVNVQKDTTEIEDVFALSTDNVLMKGEAILTFKTEDAHAFLGTKDAFQALIRFGRSEFRNGMSGESSDDLEKPETKTTLGETVLARLKVKGHEFGINVLGFTIPEILPPKEISDAAAKLRREIAEAEAEDVELTNVMKWIDRLGDKGVKPELALETMQTERGKAPAERKIIRFEGVQGVADTLAQALVSATSGKGGRQ